MSIRWQQRELPGPPGAAWRPQVVALPSGAPSPPELPASGARTGTAGRLLRRARAADALPFALLLVGCNLAVLVGSGVVTCRLFVLAYLAVVPGAGLLSLTRLRPAELSVRLAWSLGASLLLLMGVGLVESLALPHLGVPRPLAERPLLAGIDVVALALAVLGDRRRRDPLAYLVRGSCPRAGQLAVAGLLALLPLGALVGAERLNNGGGGGISVAVLVAVCALFLALPIAAPRLPGWSLGAALYAAALATLLMSSMRSDYPFGSDIQTEYHVFSLTLQHGSWQVPHRGDAYLAMLSITVLPAALSALSHVTGLLLYKLLYPMVFALFPVMVLAVSARFFSARAALVGALVVVAQGFYAADMTGLARQEIGLLYFALLVVTAFDRSLRRSVRQAGVIAAGVGMAVTHYSTAYFAATVLVVGYLAYGLLRLVRRPGRRAAVITLPVLVATVGSILLWNVVITRSAGNVVDLETSLAEHGPEILAGSKGASLLERFLNADVTTSVSPAKAVASATSFYRKADPWIRPYPSSIVRAYPVHPGSVPTIVRSTPHGLTSTVNVLTTAGNELLLLLIGIGVLALLWRERRLARPEMSELTALALGCLVLLGLLRLSANLSTFYNAPRGQVQGAMVLSVGLALVCSWLFERRYVGRALQAGAAAGIAFLLFSYSGLSDYVLGGGSEATLVNYGEQYQRYYFTQADLASVRWVASVHRPADVLYADPYGALQFGEATSVQVNVPTLLPPVIDRGAFVYASSTNVVDGTSRGGVDSQFSVFAFPGAFLQRVKDLVFTTGTTEVFR